MPGPIDAPPSRRLPRVPARVPGRVPGSSPGSRSSSRTSGWPTRRPARGATGSRRRRSPSSAGRAAPVGRELVGGPATVDELVAVTGLPVATVLATLTLLERRGLVGRGLRSLPAGRDARPGRTARRRPRRRRPAPPRERDPARRRLPVRATDATLTARSSTPKRPARARLRAPPHAPAGASSIAKAGHRAAGRPRPRRRLREHRAASLDRWPGSAFAVGLGALLGARRHRRRADPRRRPRPRSAPTCR